MNSAFMSVAVQGSTGRALAVRAKLELAGCLCREDRVLRRWRRDGATVLHAVTGDDLAELAHLAEVSRAITGVRMAVAVPAAFQPVWSIWPAIMPLGLELLVVDDDDATAQLDALHDALKDDAMLRSTMRSHITIKPRGRWQGYGDPS